MKRVNSILDTVGKTPIVKLHHVVPNGPHTFWAKIEYMNPGLSVKDRIAVAIIEDAEKKGLLKPGSTIIEATSGNTGLGLAMVSAVKGYKSIFVMPDKISEEKRAILRAYGAKVIITPTAVEPNDPRSYYSVAQKLVDITPNSFYANQYHNNINPMAHYQTTGPEIWEQMEGNVDIVVGGAGTGGTVSGIARYLKEQNPHIKVVCADPRGSILSDNFYFKETRTPAHSYKIEGIGEDIIPSNVHFNLLDDFITVDDAPAFHKCRELTSKEGLCVGPSSAAALVAAIEYSKKLTKPSQIVIIFPDSGRSYLSKAFNDEWLKENDFLPSPLKMHSVEELLKDRSGPHKLISATVDETVHQVVSKLKEFGISQIPVRTDGNIVGIINEKDLLFSLSSGQMQPHEPIIHLVKGSVIEVSLNDPLSRISELFQKGYVAMVKDKSGDYNIVTRIDLLDFLESHN